MRVEGASEGRGKHVDEGGDVNRIELADHLGLGFRLRLDRRAGGGGHLSAGLGTSESTVWGKGKAGRSWAGGEGMDTL